MARRSIGGVLRELRARQGLTQLQLAERLGTRQAVVSARENGSSGVPVEQLEGYVRDADAALLLTPRGWEVWESPTLALPSYGAVPCGQPLAVAEEADEIDFGDLTDGLWDGARCFLIRADGDSMEPLIRSGDWLIVDRRRTWAEFDVVVATVGEFTTVKQVQAHPERWGEWVLAPLNERHSLIDAGDETVAIHGVVVGQLRCRRVGR
ncbi:MAG: helix-turn-helix domain-containing protein [Fimbriimonadaceae bacterium]|nr:helix-turn-helix domain-containing protein [Fimbriimonadaceae bacterium]